MRGLNGQQVQARVQAGQVNQVQQRSSRRLSDILRSNVLTLFNGLLGSLLVVILAIGPLQDALFGGVLVANTLIGILQEWRAKRTLEALAVVTAPQASVLRDGDWRIIPAAALVVDDVVRVAAGDQVVVDGRLLEAQALEVDESLLTGEAEPVARQAGEALLSGSFIVAGQGIYTATRVGGQAYAQQLAAEGRRYRHVHSELRSGINYILRWIGWAFVPVGALLFASQFRVHEQMADALRAAVAGLVPMVPEGLVLLTSIALATAVIRIGRRHALIQELAAVEMLARVDVICCDKTGTLTEGEPRVVAVEALADHPEFQAALGALAANDPSPNGSIRAVATYARPPGWQPQAVVPFSSARKWSGAAFAGHGSWVLGAPDLLLAGTSGSETVREQAAVHARAGRRTLLLARTDVPLVPGPPPAALLPVALVIIAEQVRADVAQTLAFFRAQGVALKVLSGDHPFTVGAIARQAGVPGADCPVDALAAGQPLAALIEHRAVFGRVSPHDKQQMIAALQANGHTVAMLGDGVNDVPGLKQADIGIAMGSGSAASRAVAQMILLRGEFAALPAVVAEGRRVIANIERTAALFLTKTVYAMLLVIGVVLAVHAFPFLPRQLTLIGTLTIGLPAFFISLAPNPRRARPGLVQRALRFAVPAGFLAALATFLAYMWGHNLPDLLLPQVRGTVAIVLFGCGWWGLLILARPLTGWRWLLLGAMALAFLSVLLWSPMQLFFALDLPPANVLPATLALLLAACLAMEGVTRVTWRGGD